MNHHGRHVRPQMPRKRPFPGGHDQGIWVASGPELLSTCRVSFQGPRRLPWHQASRSCRRSRVLTDEDRMGGITR